MTKKGVCPKKLMLLIFYCAIPVNLRYLDDDLDDPCMCTEEKFLETFQLSHPFADTCFNLCILSYVLDMQQSHSVQSIFSSEPSLYGREITVI